MPGFWRALLGREKASQTASVYVQQTSRPHPTPHDFRNFAREAYQLNIIAYRCIALIAESAASVPWTLYRGDDEVEQNELMQRLARPNAMQSGVDWLTEVYSYDLLAGNSYIEQVRAGRSFELYAPRPDRMTIVPGPMGWPSQYVYKVGQKETRFDVDPLTGRSHILHLKHFNPLDDWYGQSPLAAAAYAVDQHNAGSLWNLGLLQNSGRPSGALQYSPREGSESMPDDQFHRLKAEIDEGKGAKGNPGRPMLLDGGLKWVQMALTQADMDWLQGLDKAASYIAQAFNVPEQLVGVPGQQTYSNYREARLALYEDAVLPLVNRYAHALTEWLVRPLLGDQYRLGYDDDNIPALAVRKESQWDRVGKANFLTMNEKRAALGYKPVDGGDVILVGAGQLPLTFAADPPDLTMDVEKAAQLAYGRG